MQLGRGARSLTVSLMIVSMALLACKKKKAAASESVGAAAPAATPAPAPLPATPTKTFGLNDKATLDGVAVTIEEFKDCRLDNFYSRRSLAKKKEKLVGANVIFEGNGDTDHSISYTNFKVTDPEGLTYRSTILSRTDCNPTLKSGRVAKGEKSRGWVLFQVPDKTKGLKIVFANRRPYRVGTSPGDMEQKVTFSPGS